MVRQFDSDHVCAQLLRGGQGRDPEQVMAEAVGFGAVLVALVLAGILVAFLGWASQPNPEDAAYGPQVELRQ